MDLNYLTTGLQDVPERLVQMQSFLPLTVTYLYLESESSRPQPSVPHPPQPRIVVKFGGSR